MCCLFATMVLFGPRLAILIWWLFDSTRWQLAFNNFLWAFLGWLFLPWTTLMYVLVAPTGNIVGFDWVWLGIAFLVDIGGYVSSGYGNRARFSRA